MSDKLKALKYACISVSVIYGGFLLLALLVQDWIQIKQLPAVLQNSKWFYQLSKPFVLENGETKLIHSGGQRFRMSPDGDLIAASFFPRKEVVDLIADQGIVETIETKVPPKNLEWNSDGSKLLYFGPVSGISKDADLKERLSLYKDRVWHYGYLYDLKNKTHTRVIESDDGYVSSFRFSPKNRRLAFKKTLGKNNGFYIMNLETFRATNHLDGFGIYIVGWENEGSMILMVMDYPKGWRNEARGWRQRFAELGYYWDGLVAKAMIIRYDIDNEKFVKLGDFPHKVIGSATYQNGFMCYERTIVKRAVGNPKLLALDLKTFVEYPITVNGINGKPLHVIGQSVQCIIPAK